MDNKENYNLNDLNSINKNGASALNSSSSSPPNVSSSLSRSSSTCSLFNLGITSPSSPNHSTSPSLFNKQQQQQYKYQMANNNSYFNFPQKQQQQNNDVDWSVLENAEKFLQRDDSIWINKLNKELWWNMSKLTDMVLLEKASAAAAAVSQNQPRIPRKICGNSNSSNLQHRIQQQQQQQQHIYNNQPNSAKFLNQQQQQQQQLAFYQQQQQQRMFNQNNGRFFANSFGQA